MPKTIVPLRHRIEASCTSVEYMLYEMGEGRYRDVEVEVTAPLHELMALLGPNAVATVWIDQERAPEVFQSTMVPSWLHRARPEIHVVRRPPRLQLVEG